jgi:hypothetical protein
VRTTAKNIRWTLFFLAIAAPKGTAQTQNQKNSDQCEKNDIEILQARTLDL